MEARYKSRGRFNRGINRIKGFNNIKLIEPEKEKKKLLILNKNYSIYLKDLSHLKVF